MKTCAKCLSTKPLDEFAPRKEAPDGRRGVCRQCKREGHKAWRDANRDHVRAKNREVMSALYSREPEKYRARSNDYYHGHKTECQERHRSWYAENREHALAYAQAWREQFAERHKANVRGWRRRNPDASRRHAAKARTHMTDAYIRRLLTSNGEEPLPSIPTDLIEAQRSLLKIKRLLKERR